MRGLTISASISSAPVLGDERLLERLLTNLIDNAIRHNIPDGEVSIQVSVSGEHPSLTISNTGPVIPSGQVSRLLQPFQRLTQRPADDEGLGLGLSIVAAIAKAHHATLSITPGERGGLGIAISSRQRPERPQPARRHSPPPDRHPMA